MKHILSIVALLAVATPLVASAAEPLKVAVLASINANDNPSGIEEYQQWLGENYRVQTVWCAPEYGPPNFQNKEESKKYERPHLLRLDEAEKCDVVLSSLCNYLCRADESRRLAELLNSKPLVGLKRSHHGINFVVPKGETLPGVIGGKHDIGTFGVRFFGHYRASRSMLLAQGQEDHPLVRGLGELLTYAPDGGYYEHEVLADDVTPLLITADGVMPQAWVRVNKETGRRLVYTRHDPIDLKHEQVRTLVTRAIFWAAQVDEADYGVKRP